MEEDNPDENPKEVPPAAPKKIALKVPSLFIKGAGALDKDKGVSNKKEENETKSADNSDAKTETILKKPSRPMPAFAKRKLEQKQNGLGQGESSKSSATATVQDSGVGLEVPPLGSSGTVSSPLGSPPRESSNELATSNDRSSEGFATRTKPFIKKPMPASARKRLEEKSSSDIANEPKEVPAIQTDGGEVKDSSLGDSAINKINISLSLGGIKLPTFKKPTSSTRDKKSDDENEEPRALKTTQRDDDAQPDSHEEDDDSEESSNAGRRTARRSGATELLALEDPQHVCETCGASFSQLSKKKQHIERIHLGIRKEKPKVNEEVKEEKKKDRTCKICSRIFPNKKTYRDHVRKCRRPTKSCALCDQKFSSEKELIKHIKGHAKSKQETNQDPDEPQQISTQSIFDSNDIIVPASPVSVVKSDSDEDDKKEGDDSRHSSNESSNSGVSSTKTASSKQSIKRKVAQALTNFASKKSKQTNGSGMESIQARPMPASIKKKLEERGRSSSIEKSSHLDKLACRVCNNRFSSFGNRIRHEKTVHSFFEPDEDRQQNLEGTEKQSNVSASTTCSVCHREFSDRWGRVRHERNVHKLNDNATVSSSLDSPASKDKEESTAEEVRPPGSNSLRCSVCLKFFSSSSSRSKHERRVHGLKSSKKAKHAHAPKSRSDKVCRFCGKRFSHRWKTKRHERETHLRKDQLSPTKKLLSPSKGKPESEKDIPLNPVRKEGDQAAKPKPKSIKINQCEVCFRVFSQADNRRRHEKIVHSVANPRPGSKTKSIDERQDSEESSPRKEDDDVDDSKSEVGADTETEEETGDADVPENTDTDQNTGVKKAIEFISKAPNFDGGRCPICLKFLQQQLKRHIVNVHKVGGSKELKSKAEKDEEDAKIIRAKQLLKGLNSKMGGRCPVCNVFMKTKLRRHFERRHPGVMSSEVSKPAAVQPPSYKIYKSAKDKLKRKLASSNSNITTSPVKNATAPSPGKSLQEISASIIAKLQSPCCQTPITLKDEYSEHKAMRQPKKKFYIACKICWNMFSHNEDFLLHMKFRHFDVTSGKTSSSTAPSKESSSKVKTPIKSSSKPSHHSPLPPSLKKEEPIRSPASRRGMRRDSDLTSVAPPSLELQEPSGPRKRESTKRRVGSSISIIPKMTKCSVAILKSEKAKADKKLKKVKSSEKKAKAAKKKASVKTKLPSPEPYDDDNGHYDDEPMHSYNEDTETMDDDNAEVTSTAATTPASTKKEMKEKSEEVSSFGLNEMPCSTCKEVFYSFEALRKHELYFHNVKTSTTMCPICGVYPTTELSLHLTDHENKTVKCSCAPCSMDFSNFGKLRKHNLELHPEPNTEREASSSSAPSHSRPETLKKGKESQTIFRCLLCKKKDFDMRMKARKHIKMTHSEREDDPDNYIEEIDTAQRKDEDEELDEIVQETTDKLGGSDWDSDAEPANEIQKQKSPSPPPVIKTDNKKPRSMPASVRMKLELEAKLKELQKLSAEKRDVVENKTDVNKKPTITRAMPASARAKLEREKKERQAEDPRDSNDNDNPKTPASDIQPETEVSQNNEAPKPKPSRPMPASIRAKLEREKKEKENQSSNDNPGTPSDISRTESEAAKLNEEPPKSKPSRAMPASIRAKLEREKKEKERVASQIQNINDDPRTPLSDASRPVTEVSKSKDEEPKPKPSRAMPASVRAKLEREKKEKESASEANEEDNDDPRTPSDISRSETETQASKVVEEQEPPKTKPSRPMPASIRAKFEREKKAKEAGGLDVSDDSRAPSDISRVETGGSKEEPPKAMPSRPMPASARAKLLSKSEGNDSATEEKQVLGPESTQTFGSLSRPSRAMPASAKAKLRNKAELKEVVSASAPEKADGASSSDEDAGAKDNKDDDEDYVPSAPATPPSSPDMNVSEDDNDEDVLVTSNGEIQVPGNDNPVDDNDDVQVIDDLGVKDREADSKKDEEIVKAPEDDVVVVGDDEGEVLQKPNKTAEPPAEVQKESTSEEMSEHDKAVKIAMGELSPNQAGINVKITYQCKLCSKTFDTPDSIRRHIRRGHSEYGPEHTENLIEQIYEETRTESTEDPSRKRKRTTRYTEEEYLDAHDELEEDDVEAEVIIKRGTSTRMRMEVVAERDEMPDFVLQSNETPSAPKERSMTAQGNIRYACRFCGRQMDSSANVKRHIAKGHPVEYNKKVNGVIELRPGVEPPPILYDPKEGKECKKPPKTPDAKEYKCRICHWKLMKYHSMYLHVRRSHPEIGKAKAGSFIEPVYEGDNSQSFTSGGEAASEVPTYSCINCDYVTWDENEYVRHYKKHTGVSPYQCQYCAGTFNRNQQLVAHLDREHTGAEFLNEDEEEFIMEDVTGANEIQVSTTVPIQIEQPKALILQRGRKTTKKKAEKKETTRKKDEKKKNKEPEEEEVSDKSDDDNEENSKEVICKQEKNSGEQAGRERSPSPSPPSSPHPVSSPIETQQDDDTAEENNDEMVDVETPQRNHADLSSLFFTLGGARAPGGLEAMDDLDGGMSLD